MTLNRMISSFRAAAVEVVEGFFEGAKSFVSLKGTNPAVQQIVGAIKNFVVIKANDQNGHSPAASHPFMRYVPV